MPWTDTIERRPLTLISEGYAILEGAGQWICYRFSRPSTGPWLATWVIDPSGERRDAWLYTDDWVVTEKLARMIIAADERAHRDS